MVYGFSVFYGDGSSYYTPEFPRGGLAGSFAVRVLNYSVTGASNISFDVETRNADDTSWTSLGSNVINSVGELQWDVSSGVREICRIKIDFTGGSPAASDMVHMFIQAPSWRPY